MTPVYFPFTYVSEPVISVLRACFKQVAVYQPSGHNIPAAMQKWAHSGFFDLRVPVQNDKEKLDVIADDFKAWVKFYPKSQIERMKIEKDSVPFFNEFSTSQIKAEIKDQKSITPSDPVFNARLFLNAAQEYDMRNDELKKDLSLLDNSEQNLFNLIKGEDEADYDGSSLKNLSNKNDRSDYMVSERIMAWSRCYQLDRLARNQALSEFFVTSSRAVMDLITEKSEKVEKVIDFDTITVSAHNQPKRYDWQDHLMEKLEILEQTPWAGNAEPIKFVPLPRENAPTVSLSIYLVSEEMPCDFFQKITGSKITRASVDKKDTFLKNTLIGLVGSGLD
jgi:hypothetical protein